MDFPEHLILRLGAALGIGLLIGAERERRKGEGRSRSAAGIRTFALTALAGAVTLLVGGELLLAVSAASVAVFSAVAYSRTSRSDPGLTSEMALFATLLLGALAVVHPGAAAGLGVLVTALLAARTRHIVSSGGVDRQEAHDALFCAASLVILPLMPNTQWALWRAESATGFGAGHPHHGYKRRIYRLALNRPRYGLYLPDS
jgi:hypothetical protein